MDLYLLPAGRLAVNPQQRRANDGTDRQTDGRPTVTETLLRVPCEQCVETGKLTVVKEEADFVLRFFARVAAVDTVLTQISAVQRSQATQRNRRHRNYYLLGRIACMYCTDAVYCCRWSACMGLCLSVSHNHELC